MGLNKEYPLGYVVDHDTGLIVPGIGGGTEEGGDGGQADLGLDASADLGGGDAGTGDLGEGTPPEGEGEGGASDPDALTPEEVELLGGKNIKSKGDLLRSHLHAQAHIQRLEEERRQDRATFLELQSRLQALESGGGRPPAPPSPTTITGKDDPTYQALWNAQKFDEATAYLSAKIAAETIQAKLAASQEKVEGQVAESTRRQRLSEAKASIEKMSLDVKRFPGFDVLIRSGALHRHIQSRGEAWQSSFASVGDMFEDAYASVARKFPNLVNSGKGKGASAIGGGVGAGAKTRPGQDGPRKPAPKLDPKLWTDLVLEPTPGSQTAESVYERKFKDEEAERLRNREETQVGA